MQDSRSLIDLIYQYDNISITKTIATKIISNQCFLKSFPISFCPKIIQISEEGNQLA